MNRMKAFNENRIHVQLTIQLQCRPIQPSNGKSGSFFTLYNVVQQNAELETYRCLQALNDIQNISPKFRNFLNLPAVAFKF